MPLPNNSPRTLLLYSASDSAFAKRLYADLLQHNPSARLEKRSLGGTHINLLSFLTRLPRKSLLLLLVSPKSLLALDRPASLTSQDTLLKQILERRNYKVQPVLVQASSLPRKLRRRSLLDLTINYADHVRLLSSSLPQNKIPDLFDAKNKIKVEIAGRTISSIFEDITWPRKDITRPKKSKILPKKSKIMLETGKRYKTGRRIFSSFNPAYDSHRLQIKSFYNKPVKSFYIKPGAGLSGISDFNQNKTSGNADLSIDDSSDNASHHRFSAPARRPTARLSGRKTGKGKPVSKTSAKTSVGKTPALAVSPPVETRQVNIEIMGQKPEQPLIMGKTVTLIFDVDVTARADSLVQGETGHLPNVFAADETEVKLIVALNSDDFDVYSDPQTLRLPKQGPSLNKARFDIAPKHPGTGVLHALLTRDGNFLHDYTITLQTVDGTSLVLGAGPAMPSAQGESGAANQSKPLMSPVTLPGLTVKADGRPLESASTLLPRDILLIIDSQGDKGFEFRLVDKAIRSCTIPLTLAELARMNSNVRQTLADVVGPLDAAGKVTVTSYQTGIEITPATHLDALQKVAKAGYLLYHDLFYGPSADAQAREVGDQLRELSRRERLHIQIVSDRFLLPWSVLYLADTFDAEAIDIECFLGIKHIIEQIPKQQTTYVLDQCINSHPQVTVSLNINDDIDTQTKRPLVAGQMQYWQRWQQQGKTVYSVRRTVEEVYKALADGMLPDQILYFYCHAAAESIMPGSDAVLPARLIFTGSNRLTLEDLTLFAPADKQPLPHAPLVFINACESAELSPLFYTGFIPYFMQKGARGVIGTECQIPTVFAAGWAARFFDLFLTGVPLGEVMWRLRREFCIDHNNIMGLLYALYCNGDTQVNPGLTPLSAL